MLVAGWTLAVERASTAEHLVEHAPERPMLGTLQSHGPRGRSKAETRSSSELLKDSLE